MKPVYMEHAHDPPRSWGDCLRASVASLLGVGRDQVPHFLDKGVVEWWPAFATWMAERGLYVNEQPADLVTPPGYYLAFGRTGGEGHCVVGKAGKVAFDPRPHSRTAFVVESVGMLILTDADKFQAWKSRCSS